MDNIGEILIVARLIERAALSLLIISVALVVMIAFWRSVQKISFDGSSHVPGLAGSAVFATPVFVLITLVAFVYISLSNPVSFTSGGDYLNDFRGAIGFSSMTNDESARLAASVIAFRDFYREERPNVDNQALRAQLQVADEQLEDLLAMLVDERFGSESYTLYVRLGEMQRIDPASFQAMSDDQKRAFREIEAFLSNAELLR